MSRKKLEKKKKRNIKMLTGVLSIVFNFDEEHIKFIWFPVIDEFKDHLNCIVCKAKKQRKY